MRENRLVALPPFTLLGEFKALPDPLALGRAQEPHPALLALWASNHGPLALAPCLPKYVCLYMFTKYVLLKSAYDDILYYCM